MRLNYPTRDRLAVEEQSVVKGRTGLVSGLPAPDAEVHGLRGGRYDPRER